MNNADLGMTAQYLICNRFKLNPIKHAYEQFLSNYNSKYELALNDLITDIFKELDSKPIERLTFKPDFFSKRTIYNL